jgi:hypothetical protein
MSRLRVSLKSTAFVIGTLRELTADGCISAV